MLPRETTTLNDKDQSKDDSRNRKRGRGKIKITKREKVNNAELRDELVKYINSKPRKASERLGELFIDLVDNYATKSSWSGYSFLEEMKSRGIYFLLAYSTSFDPKKSSNAFAYCTQIVKNAFRQVINKEKKHADTKKALIEKYRAEHKDFFKKDDEIIN